jgi:hypothetical protein
LGCLGRVLARPGQDGTPQRFALCPLARKPGPGMLAARHLGAYITVQLVGLPRFVSGENWAIPRCLREGRRISCNIARWK